VGVYVICSCWAVFYCLLLGERVFISVFVDVCGSVSVDFSIKDFTFLLDLIWRVRWLSQNIQLKITICIGWCVHTHTLLYLLMRTTYIQYY